LKKEMALKKALVSVGGCCGRNLKSAGPPWGGYSKGRDIRARRNTC